jgi:hypothetical protein
MDVNGLVQAIETVGRDRRMCKRESIVLGKRQAKTEAN